ncbi:LOW QUALITY PROTEIN: hypothetical protein PHMEG_00026348 [Phytophthora megakarya]|uniref:PiggyBac transposable element-derived protein domain-containing protein n=1 Tax=Phytophthora megakarya TaxID=4795 RepID=A0A225VB65_9STRA|nr:LOW QUALITY PROTEIN: hypothetical protein PHMEG_00026348 [Phytophthora megakarya]
MEIGYLNWIPKHRVIDEELNMSQEGEDDDSDPSDNDDFEFPVPADSGTVSGETPIVFDVSEEQLDELAEGGWETYDEHRSSGMLVDPAQLYTGTSGPTRAALAFAENPLAIFYLVLPNELWRKIAAESNAFREENINEVAEKMRERAQAQRSTVVLSVDEYKSKLRRKLPLQPPELVRFIGLLIARTLEPRRECLERHWITKAEGALARGTFGQFMSRDRFEDIARYMLFNDNAKQNGTDATQTQSNTSVYADEAKQVEHEIIHDVLRTYGLLFKNSEYIPVITEHVTEYTHHVVVVLNRLDIYYGKANEDEENVEQRAVLKNLAEVLRGQETNRLVCTDNFYTSIPLSHKLQTMGYSHVGTIRKDRKGWCSAIEFKEKKRPKQVPRGTFRLAVWRDHPQKVGVNWMDNKPLTHVTRREKDSTQSSVPRLQPVHDYHKAMGGVDVHDHLRLQSYSIQRSIRMRKYYIFWVDIAVVNAFILHKIAMKTRKKKVPTHAAFLRRLHADLLGQTREDFKRGDDLEDLVTKPLPQHKHTLEQTDEMNGSKRRQWLCKVFSAYAGAGVRSYETSYFCSTCSCVKNGRVTLCNKPRRVDEAPRFTCDQVWHQSWKNGMAIPPDLQHKIRFVSKRRPEVVSEDQVE